MTLANKLFNYTEFETLWENPDYFAPVIVKKRAFKKIHRELLRELRSASSGELLVDKRDIRKARFGGSLEGGNSYNIKFRGAALSYIFSSVGVDYLEMTDLAKRLRDFLIQVIKYGSPEIGNPSVKIAKRNIKTAESSSEFKCPKPWC